MFHLLNLLGFPFDMFVSSLYWYTTSSTLCYSSALGFNFNMTKRDSFFAGIDSPRAPTSMQRRHLQLEGQSSSGATSSGRQFLYRIRLPTISMKKPTHSKRKSNNSTEFSILTSSQRSYLLIRQASIASW